MHDNDDDPTNDFRAKTESNTNGAPESKEITSIHDTNIQYIEKILSEGYRSISEALEEQNTLLRELVKSLETRTVPVPSTTGQQSISSPHSPNDPSSDPRSSDRSRSGRENGIKKDVRPPSRLQKMSRALNTLDEDPGMSLQVSPHGITKRDQSTRHANDPSSTDMIKSSLSSLAERKKEFAMKTASVSQKGAGLRDRTRLAMAAAKREMHREQSRVQEMREIERQQSNSLGSWILFVIIGMLGVAAFILGIVAMMHHASLQSTVQVHGNRTKDEF